MNMGGYDPDRFVGTGHQTFQCPICTMIVIEPYECNSCGKLFCKGCITSWAAKQADNKCPNRCGSSTNNIKPIFSKALMRLYTNLDIKCKNQKCKKTLKLIDLPKHQSSCLLVKCWNVDLCGRPHNAAIKALQPCCSMVCESVLMLKERFGDRKAMYEILGKFIQSAPGGNQIQVGKPPIGGMVNLPPPMGGGGGKLNLVWDPSKSGGSIQLTQNGAHCFLKQQSYLFRTTLTSEGYTSGIHYWQILADSRTENELKIGVSLSNQFDFNSAFCDHPFGYSYYGLGQLRHGSNAAGPAYGKKFKKDGTLGVFLNMNTGVLAFSLNGEYMGVAYRDPKLTQGPIFPAVALLHCAGCKLRSGLSVPAYFKD